MFAVKHPKRGWEQREGIPTLAQMQEIVGGNIEHFYLPLKGRMGNEKQIDLFVNEEGKLLDLPVNIGILNIDELALVDILVGPIIAVRHDLEGETATLTDDDLGILKRLEGAVKTEELVFIPAEHEMFSYALRRLGRESS